MQLIQNAYKTKAFYMEISSLNSSLDSNSVKAEKGKTTVIARCWFLISGHQIWCEIQRHLVIKLHLPFISSNGLLPSPVFDVGCDPHCSSDRWSLFFGRPTGLWAGRSNLQQQMWSRNGVCSQQKFEFLNNAMNHVFYVVSYGCDGCGLWSKIT